jgi:peptidoglycan/xylan/chitin deacetylase (PgdA/CDA1 family)
MREPLRRLYLLYHELRPGKSAYSYSLDTGEFEKQLDLFAQIGRTEQQCLQPELTFDDGHISNFQFAVPMLQARGLQARFFITAGWTGRRAGYMGWQELRSLLEAGQSIGAHGLTHTLLTHCGEKELRAELRDAKDLLEDKLGISISTMSLPGGRYNRRVLSACQEAGYTRIYTSVPRAEFEPGGLTVGRLNIRGDMTLEWISTLLQPDGKVLANVGRQYQLKSAAKSLLGDRLYEKLWAFANRRESDSDAGEAAANEDFARYQ